MAAKLCVVPRNTSDTPRSRLLGAKIRHQREARHFGLREFAGMIGVHPSTYSKWENGKLLPDLETVGVILGALGVVGDDRDDILQDARDASNPDWIADGVDRQVSALVEYERTAIRMVACAPLFTAGMLQNEGTAHAIVAAGGTTSDSQAKAIVSARMARKEALWRTNPIRLDVFLGMRAIERPLGGLPVAIEQLKYTLKMAQLTNVTVRAIPETDEFNPADMGGFVLYEFAVGDPIVYFEHFRSSMFAPKRDVPDMVKAVERLEKIAMSPDATSRLIADVITRMERRHHDSTLGA